MLHKLVWAVLLSLPCSLFAKDLPVCLFVSSYHQGYDWSDGVERGLRASLNGHCTITSFNMNAKRHTSVAHAQQAALAAKALIEKLKPDVVIASDDAAAKYLIVPYYKDAALPFVFCGINWTVEQYGFPYSNVTGMIEVAAVNRLFQKAQAIVGKIRHVSYLGANTLTERKNLAHFEQTAAELNFQLTSRLSSTRSEWIKSYQQAQTSELIIIGSNAGIKDWDETKILAAIKPETKTLSVTNHAWMMPYTMFGMTKVPEEQGEWAGQVAIEILRGTSPADIPIIPNRKFDLIMNKDLLDVARITLPESIKLKARPYY